MLHHLALLRQVPLQKPVYLDAAAFKQCKAHNQAAAERRKSVVRHVLLLLRSSCCN